MIFLPFSSILIYFIHYQRKNNRKIGIISMLIFTYLLTTFLGLILYYSNILIPVYDISFLPMAYFTGCILIVFYGFSTFKDDNIVGIKIDNLLFLNILEKIILFGSIFSILFFTSFAIQAFQGDINQNRLNLSQTQSVLGNYGIINSIASLFANLFVLAQMFFFVHLIPKGNVISKRKAIIMLLASFSYIIYIFAYVGRDGVVFWLMSFVFQFLFFNKFIIPTLRRKLIKLSINLSIVLLIPFMIITFSRFKESPIGVYFEVINYIGQQIINFNDHFNIQAPLQAGNINFPELAKLFRGIGFSIPEPMENTDFFLYYLSNDVQPWTFSTFIGSFKADFGVMGTLLFCIIFSFLVHRIMKKSINSMYVTISNYIIIILFYQIVYFGVFYFRQYSANFYILAMIFIYILLKIKIKNKKSIILSSI